MNLRRSSGHAMPEEGTPMTTTASRDAGEHPSDEDLVRRIRAGDTAMFEVLMRRYNQRLYRVARGILRNHADAEDVLQQAYLNAYAHLHQYEHRGSFAGWLTRIAVHEAFARHRRRAEAALESIVGNGPSDRIPSPRPDPEQAALSSELRRNLETSIDSLAETYRPVFVLREVEGLSTSETAEALGLSEDAVKTRLRRARAMLREALAGDGRRPGDLLRFGLEQCDRVVAAVLARLTVTVNKGLEGLS
jgi:RNA polymerase sigma-70 factor, ECF subfamily